MTEQVKTFSSGAQSSAGKAGYWMIPFVVLRAVAERFDLGALKYDAHNWKRGCQDPEFMRDRFNHLFEHLMKFKEGGDEEDDMEGSIIAVLINVVFLTYWTITHRREVEAAFPTEAPAIAMEKSPLEKLKAAANKVPLPSVDVAGETRHAIAEMPQVDGSGETVRMVMKPQAPKQRVRTNFDITPPEVQAMAKHQPGTPPADGEGYQVDKAPGQKIPLPQDTGNQQFC